ncbi:MAG TPA: septal ring lytic transglycosylase RlpA family protein [Thermoanaerobaculia bacterium]
MRLRALIVAVILFGAYGCATTAPPPRPADTLEGVASWYGEEFAGRTTANGEIFDPMQLTAAHRTLPFGTVIDVTNPKTSQTVRVRINDRGPYVGNRILDLSYAAAQQIGLIQPGSGEVGIKVVRIGRGDREPPVPYTVTIEEPKEKVVISSGEAPPVPFPLPSGAPAPSDDDTFTVAVEEERRGVPTRRQVAADGRTIEEVPITADSPGEVPAAVMDRPAARRVVVQPSSTKGKFAVQAGAFSVESNAKALQDRLTRIGQTAFIDREGALYRVRLGPFATRDEAVKTRTALEAQGMSAIIVTD